MIIPIHNADSNGNVLITEDELVQICKLVHDDAYAEGYQDGCADTYMQCVANITNTAITKKETTNNFFKKDKPSLRG